MQVHAFSLKLWFCCALLVFGLLPSSAFAYSISWMVSAGPSASTHEVVPIRFDYTMDLTSPPPGVLSDTERVQGLLNFGNGQHGAINLSLSAPAGSIDRASQQFFTAYNIPGTYTLDGNLNVTDFLCHTGGCDRSVRNFNIAPISVVVKMSAEEKAAHLKAARDARLRALTVEVYNTLSGLSASVAEAVVNLILAGISAATANWAQIFGIAASIIAAAYFGGAAGLALATVASLVGAYHAATDAIETKLAEDPPDSNYQQVYEYGSYAADTDFGFGEDFNMFMGEGFTLISQLTDARQGQLTSLERGQGALLAGDLAAVARQSAALDEFVADYARIAPFVGNWFASVPGYMRERGYDVGDPHVDLLYTALRETARDLGAEPNAVPEPGTLLLLGTGLAGLACRRYSRARPA